MVIWKNLYFPNRLTHPSTELNIQNRPKFEKTYNDENRYIQTLERSIIHKNVQLLTVGYIPQ